MYPEREYLFGRSCTDVHIKDDTGIVVFLTEISPERRPQIPSVTMALNRIRFSISANEIKNCAFLFRHISFYSQHPPTNVYFATLLMEQTPSTFLPPRRP